MRTMNIGRLNRRITFMKLVDSTDCMGQSVKKLETVKTVWASFYPVRNTEFYEVQKIQSKVTHKCYIRYLDGVDSRSLICHDNKLYRIDSVIDVDMEHKMLEIMCYENDDKEVIDYA